LNVDRLMASELGLTMLDVSGSVLVSLSSTSQVSPNFWVSPQNRVNYRVAVQTPPDSIGSVDELLNTPIIHAQTGPQTPSNPQTPGKPQLLSNLADLGRSTSAANTTHYDVQPTYDVYANVQGRDLAA